MPTPNESSCCAESPPPPHIRRAVSSQLQKHKQENDPLHPLFLSLSKNQPIGDWYQDTASFTLLNPLMAAPALEDCLSGPAIFRQHRANFPLAPRKRYLQGRVRHGPPDKLKSPPNRDWTMQSPDAEMRMQRGWTDNVRMWCWTYNETPASLPQSCHNPVLMKTWKCSTSRQILRSTLGGSRIVTRW